MIFFCRFFGFVFILLAAVGGLNLFVDPYGYWGGRFIPPAASDAENPRFYHPLRLAAGRYDVVFLGSSRVREGFLPADVGGGMSAYNAGMSGASAYETGRFMSFIAGLPVVPSSVVVGVDFFGFAPGLYYQDDAANGPLGGEPLWFLKIKNLFVADTLKASIRSVKGYIKGKTHALPVFFGSYADGGDVRAKFDAGLREHASVALARFDPAMDAIDPKILEAYAQGVEALVVRGVTVHLVVSPLHAARMDLISQIGLGGHYQNVLAVLRDISAKADSSGHGKVALWNFSGCGNVYQLEALPDGEGKTMQWYYDANHFKPALGRIMLDRIFHGEGPVWQGLSVFPAQDGRPEDVSLQDWGACARASGMDISGLVEQTREARCSFNSKWCGR